jgi:hypothetical protein
VLSRAGTPLRGGVRVAGDLPLEPDELVGQGGAAIRLRGQALELEGAIEHLFHDRRAQDVALELLEQVAVERRHRGRQAVRAEARRGRQPTSAAAILHQVFFTEVGARQGESGLHILAYFLVHTGGIGSWVVLSVLAAFS